MNELDAFLQGCGVTAGTQIVGAEQQILGQLQQLQGQNVGALGLPAQGIMQQQSRLQRVMAGITQSAIAAAGTFDSNVNVSESFRPDRIILNTASWALNVTNLRMGTKSMNVSAAPVSGECFARDSVGGWLQGYTAQQGVGFVLSFQNPTAGAITCSGGVFGPGLN